MIDNISALHYAKGMTIVTYSRVSTSHHDQKPEVQVNELRKFCQQRGWSIAEELVDHGFSGGTDNRPGLKRLMELVRAKSINVIVVVKLDRLFRSLKHLITTLEEFNKLGVTFIAVRDQVDYSTPAGRLFVQILGSLGEFEKSLLRERTLMGLDYAKSKGVQLGRPRKHSVKTILALRNQGLTYRQIQKQTNIPMGSITKAIKSAPKTQNKEGG